MSVLTKAWQRRVQKVLAEPTFYESLLARGVKPSSLLRRRKFNPKDALEGTLSLQRELRKPLRLTKYDHHLAEVGNVGLLSVRKGRYRKVAGRALYTAHCGCGNRIYLTAREIVERHKQGVGCCQEDCSAPPIEAQFFYRPSLAIKLQLTQLATRFPSAMHPRWKGSVTEATAVLMYQLADKLEDCNGRFWFTNILVNGLNEASDLELGVEPSKDLFPDYSIVVRYNGNLTTLEYAAELAGVDKRDALALRLIYYDNQLIHRLFGR